ncbi:deoxyguanosinetriphosphate triphosphohydrolase [Ignatzschineria rhizosphaerae]|uniref:Deoxyguanosinetriphosphate triphosphohydrolase n=1 Tax=Ignatzschineria rhizosphaerae TaxID=2923279 RepID=A0ABY3X1V7_9GAMM|nr:deoxyguanosinetriphosphate triphosphohydrolase [Ignatzschineria rhizosphaerae]UNM96868.1 deoxyguanosinetriphosphate triphosphohydrolase [Ignatzschineria rhizosphaerae]
MNDLYLKQRWQELLPQARLGVNSSFDVQSYRTDFQKDFDRLIFSAAFRRLQDKTQVFPLAQTDYVRTRLTHSLEVSSVCRSFGSMLGEYLVENGRLENITPADLGAILAAGALAHDIGNPPFGHAGEEAISRFFKRNPVGQEVVAKMSDAEKADFLAFEGNAQAFRVLTRLQNSDNRGGLQLSLPVLASIIKYPCASSQKPDEHNIAFKKFNYFQSEKALFAEVVQKCHLVKHKTIEGAWYRHPLTYLLEAADDICYHLVDLEDAYRLSLISSEEIIHYLEAVISVTAQLPTNKLAKIGRTKDKVEYLRAFAIGLLIEQAMQVFKDHEEAIVSGKFTTGLLDHIPATEVLSKIKAYSQEHVYHSDTVLEVGIAGFKVLDTLLEAFVGAVEQGDQGGARTKMLLKFLPDQFFTEDRRVSDDPYTRVQQVTDFVSGMTDRYAVKVFKMITGVDLPV